MEIDKGIYMNKENVLDATWQYEDVCACKIHINGGFGCVCHGGL